MEPSRLAFGKLPAHAAPCAYARSLGLHFAVLLCPNRVIKLLFLFTLVRLRSVRFGCIICRHFTQLSLPRLIWGELMRFGLVLLTLLSHSVVVQPARAPRPLGFHRL